MISILKEYMTSQKLIENVVDLMLCLRIRFELVVLATCYNTDFADSEFSKSPSALMTRCYGVQSTSNAKKQIMPKASIVLIRLDLKVLICLSRDLCRDPIFFSIIKVLYFDSVSGLWDQASRQTAPHVYT